MSSNKLKGIGASDGIGIGNILVIKEADLNYDKSPAEDIDAEKKRFNKALKSFAKRTESEAKKLRNSAGDKEAEILEGHLLLATDETMTGQILEMIEGGSRAEAAVDGACNAFIDMFSGMEDDLMRQRAADIKDVRDELLKLLLGIKDTDLGSLPPNTILVARDIAPSMTSKFKKKNIAGIITEVGTATSHLAIIAKAMEIPLISSVPEALSIVKDGEPAVMNGKTGIAELSPDETTLAEYQESLRKELEHKAELKSFRRKKTRTLGGERIQLLCNIGTPAEVASVIKETGEGIGLFRTEFLFMNRQCEPCEDEQFEAYKEVAVAMKGKPVIIRTLDIGGDKEIPYLDLEKEANPFLGLRAIRYCLKNDGLYNRQLRAIIRASAYGNIKLMIPLVTCVEEVRSVKEMVHAIQKEYDEIGVAYNKELPIGCMIETPAAALIADILAKESDFFSIGTNDLTQYIMCADRGNNSVSNLGSYFQPAVLRSIRQIARCGKAAGIPVGICGEAAWNPNLIPLLLSFGIDEFSVSPSKVLPTRAMISKWGIHASHYVEDDTMNLETAEEILIKLFGEQLRNDLVHEKIKSEQRELDEAE